MPPKDSKLQFTLPFDQDPEVHVKKNYPEIKSWRIISQSLDARGANRGRVPTFQYIVEILNPEHEDIEQSDSIKLPQIQAKDFRPIIIGAGPAGLFCALRLLEYGVPSILLERGSRANKRMKSIAKFWRYGVLNSEDNVCFGEGGAGLFSDGKLITRIKSPYISYVMQKFVDFGAPKETAYLSNPHLGSNKIRSLISRLTTYLESKGCQFKAETKVVDLITKIDGNDLKVEGVIDQNGEKYFSPMVVLATGHSAHDIYEMLAKKKVSLLAKDFAVGVRIEHQRKLIDQIQYGQFAGHPLLGAARYRLSYHNAKSDKGTYSFCMCPGGYVLSSGTEKDGLVVNGMSNSGKSGPWTNAALVVSVKASQDYKAGENNLGGMHFQRQIEKKAFNFSLEEASGREIPTQTIQDFLSNKKTQKLPFISSCPSGTVNAKLSTILPSFIVSHLQDALLQFEKEMPGFVKQNGLLLAPETRTSAPLTIVRSKDNFQSQNCQGLYPCGEGAGYAGGITSAAVDGVLVANALVKKLLESSF